MIPDSYSVSTARPARSPPSAARRAVDRACPRSRATRRTPNSAARSCAYRFTACSSIIVHNAEHERDRERDVAACELLGEQEHQRDQHDERHESPTTTSPTTGRDRRTRERARADSAPSGATEQVHRHREEWLAGRLVGTHVTPVDRVIDTEPGLIRARGQPSRARRLPRSGCNATPAARCRRRRSGRPRRATSAREALPNADCSPHLVDDLDDF